MAGHHPYADAPKNDNDYTPIRVFASISQENPKCRWALPTGLNTTFGNRFCPGTAPIHSRTRRRSRLMVSLDLTTRLPQDKVLPNNPTARTRMRVFTLTLLGSFVLIASA